MLLLGRLALDLQIVTMLLVMVLLYSNRAFFGHVVVLIYNRILIGREHVVVATLWRCFIIQELILEVVQLVVHCRW